MIKLYYENNNLLPELIYDDKLINDILNTFQINEDNIDLLNINLYQLLTDNKIKANIVDNQILDYNYNIKNNININETYKLLDNNNYFIVKKDNILYLFNKYYYDEYKNKIYFNNNDLEKLKIYVNNFKNNLNVLSKFNII